MNTSMSDSLRRRSSWTTKCGAILLACSFAIAAAPVSARSSKSSASGSAKSTDDPGCRGCVSSAASLFAAGKNKEAAQLLREWSPKCQNYSQLQLMLSTVLLRIGADIKEVEEAARRAVAADESSIAAHLQYALVLTNDNKVNEGVEQLKKVTALDPANYEAWSTLSASYKILREDDLAAEAAATAAELEPNTLAVRMSVLRNLRKTGKLDNARTELKKMLSGKNTGAAVAQELATEALLIGSYDDCLDACKKVLAKFPSSTPALKMMALASFCSGDYNSSLASADQLLTIDKENADAQALKGLALLKLDRTGEADEPIGLALSKQPAASLSLLASGALQARKGNSQAAIDTLVAVFDADASGALSQDIPEPLAHLELASVYQKLGKASAAQDEARAAAHDQRFAKQAQQFGLK